jgi:hypothetical protein
MAISRSTVLQPRQMTLHYVIQPLYITLHCVFTRYMRHIPWTATWQQPLFTLSNIWIINHYNPNIHRPCKYDSEYFFYFTVLRKSILRRVNDRMTAERRIEGNWTEVAMIQPKICLESPREATRYTTSVRIVVPAKIRTENVPNTSLQRYRSASPRGKSENYRSRNVERNKTLQSSLN